MGQSFSEDGRLMAYALSSGGSDWRTVKLMEIDQATGEVSHRPDVLDHVKFRWSGDGLAALSLAVADTTDSSCLCVHRQLDMVVWGGWVGGCGYRYSRGEST